MAGYPKKDSKNGTYYFVLEVGKDTNGKRKQLKRCGYKKISEAKAAMAEMLLELKKGNSLKEKKLSLGEYLDYWLENYAKTNTKPKTFAEYEKIIKTHLQPSLGNIMLRELKSTQLQNYYKEKLEVLSAQSVTHHHPVLSKALNDAIDWEFVSRNVAKGAKPPKPVKREMKTHSVEQLNLLLATAKEKTPVYFPIYLCCSSHRLRKSELMGLTWNNVDFKTQKFYIRQTITEANGKYFFNQIPKNERPRGVKLTAELAKLIRTLKEEHDHRKKILGETYNPIIWSFATQKEILWLHLK